MVLFQQEALFAYFNQVLSFILSEVGYPSSLSLFWFPLSLLMIIKSQNITFTTCPFPESLFPSVCVVRIKKPSCLRPPMSIHLAVCLKWRPAVWMCHQITNATDFSLSHTNSSLFVPLLFQRPLSFKGLWVVQGQSSHH